MATTPASSNDLCHDFVRASLAYQKQLAEKVKALNGRRVYLFDATDFAAGLQDAATPDQVRYKTGTLEGEAVDAVLSVSAHQSLGVGAEAARTYLGWMGPGAQASLDRFGVYI